MLHKLFSVFIFIISISIGQEIDSLNIKTPPKAALWSILPGGGQIYNGKYFKAGVLIALESFAVYQTAKNGNEYNDSGLEIDLLDRNKNAWWTFFIHMYGLLDAVVDSHLDPFDPIMENDSLEIEVTEEEITPDG